MPQVGTYSSCYENKGLFTKPQDLAGMLYWQEPGERAWDWSFHPQEGWNNKIG